MILCAGEALIDMLPRQTAQGEDAFVPHPGGAVFNTAIALGRLGVETGFFCPLSNDHFGNLLRTALTGSGVDHVYSPVVARPCTLAFVTLTEGQARYTFYDTRTALRDMDVNELPQLPERVRALFLGGISLVGGASARSLETLMEQAGDRIVMLDPNIRPGFISDEAAYRARLDRMLARADIVKLSDEDLSWLMGEDEIDVQIARLREKGPKIVVVTEGAAGARAVNDENNVHVSAKRVQVVDTVGAGDTFNAGFLASLMRSPTLSRDDLNMLDAATLCDALSLGARAAAVTVSRAGANPPGEHEL